MLNFLLNIDFTIFYFINTIFTHQFFDLFFFWITDLHKTEYFKIIVLPLMLFLFIKSYKKYGFLIFVSLLISLGINDFVGGKVKNLVQRERPEFNPAITAIKRSHAGSYSFYSNHAANMFTFASYTSSFLPQTKIIVYSLASLVAYSRVYNGVHYPSDISFGGLVGLIWGLVSSKLLNFLIVKFKSKRKIE